MGLKDWDSFSGGDLVESVRQVEGEPGECGVGDANGWRVWNAAQGLRRRGMWRKLLRGE